MAIINLNAPSASQSPTLVVDAGAANAPANGSIDALMPFLTVGAGGNPVQTCAEFNSIYPILLPRITYANLAALTSVVNGMLAYDSTNNGIALLSNGVWSTFNQGMVTVTLNQAAVQGMYGAPVQIIPAPAAGFSIEVLKVIIVNNFSVAAFNVGGVGILQYGNAVHGAGTNALSATFPQAFIQNGASATYALPGTVGATVVGTQGLGLFMSNQTAAFGAGNAASTLVVNVWFSIIPANV